MHPTTTLPEPGQLVTVRQRRYVVNDIVQNTLTGDPLSTSALLNEHNQHLVKLSSVEDDALGEELQVIWEVEPGASTIERTPLPPPIGFDTPQRLDTFLNAVRWGAASSADIKTIQAPFRSGIDLEDYQLDPVARAIGMPRVNLLIADDVGLGKTIEAGLVAQELIIRHRARRVLIICPAPLQVQWYEQMRDKFGLEFRIVDSQALHTLRRERGLHVNPWTHFPRLITSIDFLKRERPLRLFREILPRDDESPYPRTFDLLILDEAHNVAPSGSGKYATDSQRTRTLRRLVPHFEHKLFLSATPHNGYSNSFAALLELLDNQRFARGVEPDHEQLQAIMVRRLKSELPPAWDGTPRFHERAITPLPVTYSPAEREIHHLLQQYNEARVAHAQDATEQYASEFVAKLLKKRLFSSPSAFHSTLIKHQQTLSSARRQQRHTLRPHVGILRSRVESIEEDTDDDSDQATTTALETAAPLFHAPSEQELDLLRRMTTWAAHAINQPDSQAQRLIQWLQRNIKPDGHWSSQRVIIFTEYRDTQNWLGDLLVRFGFAEKGPDGEPRLLKLFGGMQTGDREKVKAAFQANPADASVRILLATDAASEGIDLQNYCSDLIHYEIPWNPNRLEQRNGRIDRHGQRAPVVNIYHFVSSSYQQNGSTPADALDDDLEFLRKVINKIDQIREDLGNVGPVIAEQVEERMLGRRRTLDTEAAESKAPSRRLQAFARKQKNRLAEHIHQLYEQLLSGKDELGLSPANIQAVVETALELAQQPPLLPRLLEDPYGTHAPIPVFDVPDHLTGNWLDTTQGLMHPHSGKRRPIVFDQSLAQGRDDVVLAHLNHRLVTTSLRLLRAEIWSSADDHKLFRVTARTVQGYAFDTPMVVAHARLLILGGDNQRLHEELLTAGGYLREGRFVRMNEGQLKEALASAQAQSVAPTMQQRLAAQWPQHRDALASALESRMRERAASLQKTLLARSEKEQSDIRTILTELQNSIYKELQQPAVVQLQFTEFNSDERTQYEHDRSALERRAQQLDEELRQEVERIQHRFSQPQPRLFPVALSYLVPARLAH